ncbi:MAG: sigma-70 family RNA polymerase sigma factor [Geothrix sp.]|uniref:RNA polymerase sigma factor n=1 Tax=Geothrix sp. TaxID=1962974 RepID=UPI0017BD4BFA|nr:sigma-70 family RNA polymerase sigma factor [Geothrix sp.]NWJ41593.1 sigma-70 family RNA polymerase sigma factor [Geothrix sp.]
MPTPLPSTPAAPLGEDDASLLQRIRAGEEDALQQLHRRHAPLVFHLACRALDRAAAEEVVQDTFLSVWRKAADFDPTRGAVRTWLLSIGHHRMLDELRARSRRPQAASDQLLDQAALWADEPLPDETLWKAYQRDAVSEALAALPEPQRAALRLAFFADLTHEEVARALKVPLGTAKTRIRSGLRQLERHLGGLVALLAVALAGTGSWLYHRRALEDAQMQRAVHLLADSQTRALRLAPAGAAVPEAGTHATFRSAPGAGIAVLTLTHFPAPPEGAQHVLWVQAQAGWKPWALPPPDRAGKVLQVLEDPWLAQAWPVRLRITVETQPTGQPSGPVVVEWREPDPPSATP